MTSRPFVDAHVHFWDPARLRYPWLAGVPLLNRAFLPEDYVAASAPAPSGAWVFVEAGCDPLQNLDEIQWISELARSEPRLRGIVAQAAVETGDAVRGQLATLVRHPLVKGVRRVLQGEPDPAFCLRPGFVAGVKALAGFGLTFDLCVVPAQLPAVARLVARCPEVRFILDHGGKPCIREGRLDPWRTHLRELAARPNVACKLSGLVTEADPARAGAEALRPYVAQVLECFGVDRVLCGGDWPVCTLAGPFGDWRSTLDTLLAGLSEAERTQLCQRNAERIYRLTPPRP